MVLNVLISPLERFSQVNNVKWSVGLARQYGAKGQNCAPYAIWFMHLLSLTLEILAIALLIICNTKLGGGTHRLRHTKQ